MAKKKKDVSNNMLAVLLGIAIVVSLAGLLLAGNGGITGLQASNTSGQGNVTVEANVALALTDASIDLGALFPGDNNASEIVDDNFTLQNNGDSPVDIATWAEGEADGDELFDEGEHNANDFMFRVGATALSGNSVGQTTTYTDMPLTYSGRSTDIITAMESTATHYVMLNVTVPQNETAGVKRATVYFEATEQN